MLNEWDEAEKWLFSSQKSVIYYRWWTHRVQFVYCISLAACLSLSFVSCIACRISIYSLIKYPMISHQWFTIIANWRRKFPSHITSSFQRVLFEGDQLQTNSSLIRRVNCMPSAVATFISFQVFFITFPFEKNFLYRFSSHSSPKAR